MSARKDGKVALRGRVSAREFLRSVPQVNRAMQTENRPDGTTLVLIPMRKPKYLVPPLSWLLPYSRNRQVELDTVGSSVLAMCDGRQNVEGIIESFAAKRKLTFRESQLAVGQFLHQLAQRGIIALVGIEEETGNT